MLRTARQRAAKELRRYGPGLTLGILSAQGVMALSGNRTLPLWIIVFLGCTGDNIGFYGFEWARQAWVTRHTRMGFWRKAQASLWITVKTYWLAEIFDIVAFRSWMLALSASFISNPGWSTLTGNVLADVLFFGVVIMTGVEFSDWLLKYAIPGKRRAQRRQREPLPVEEPLLYP